MKKNNPVDIKKGQLGSKVSKTPQVNRDSRAMLEIVEKLLNKNSKIVFGIIFILSTCLGMLLFDVKISEGNDDALYIEGGFNYSKNFSGYYFTANAPLYPMLLSVLITIFGLDLILLKSFSFVTYLLSIIFFYKSFKSNLPALVLFPVLCFVGTNSFFLYYASQTYTEALYMLLQSLFFLMIFSLIKTQNHIISKGNYKLILNWLLFGLVIFLLVLCKNVAIAAVAALAIFFIVNKKWKELLWTLSIVALFRIPFEVFKKIIWGDVARSSQLNTLLQVDPYDASKGNETIQGLVSRFFENYSLYISKRIPQICGIKSMDDVSPNVIFGLVLLVGFILGLIYGYKKKNEYVLIAGIYSIAIAAVTFIVLQTRWDQPRLILIVVPFIFLTFLYGIYNVLNFKSGFGGIIYGLLVLLFLSTSISVTTKKVFANIPILKKNLQGDVFYGYTPDWENYLRMSKWCSENLPPNSLVACRKAPMSFVYGKGMRFFPVYNVYAVDEKTGMSNPDSIINYFKSEKVTHVIVASLRRNPKRVDGYVINTIHRMLAPVMQKYPNKLELIYTIGNSEQAFLYKIKY